MRVLVIGATGVLGRNVIPRLLERGHTVRAVVRQADQARGLKHLGVDAVLGDIFDAPSLTAAARGCDAALHLATAIPKNGHTDWSRNDRVRREGTHNFIQAAINHGIQRYVQQSIALVYGECGQTIVDETAELQADAVSQSAIDMENLVRASSLDWRILRGGMFYGAGTGREDGWRQLARENRLRLPGDGSDLISLVHVVDMARAVVMATEQSASRTIYNVVDDRPVSYRALFTHIAVQLGANAPQTGGQKFLPSLGCANTKIKQELGWQPGYPTFRSGLA